MPALPSMPSDPVYGWKATRLTRGESTATGIYKRLSPLRRRQKLQPVAVGIGEINAVGIALAVADFNTGPFQHSLHFLILTRL